MLKKLKEKRVEAFKEAFPEYQTSKKGNLYYRYQPGTERYTIDYTGYSMTKGTFNKLGTSETRTIKNEVAIFLIKPDTGKLLIKHGKLKNYKLMTFKDLKMFNDEKIYKFFFIGRKYEYLKNHKILWAYRIFQNFKSLKEAKKFLGFGFLSNNDFLSLFKDYSGYNRDYIMLMGLTQNKSNVVSLLKENNHGHIFRLFDDYVRMCQEVSLTPNIPGSLKRLKEVHDDLSNTLTQRKIANASTEKLYETRYVVPDNGKRFYLYVWDDIGLSYRQLVSKQDMFRQGLKQKHCIGSAHSELLNEYSYYTITYMGKDYDIQIFPNGLIGHFYGACNTPPPKGLEKIIYDDKISYKHIIEQIREPKNEPINEHQVLERTYNELEDIHFF